ncbi:SRPBCC family protein [Nioella aestuarii]|uniref:SRPBCC family protein n=1 Tax=Nioella aestuarii TaxID=1662864 RepID=UPI003D7F5B1B
MKPTLLHHAAYRIYRLRRLISVSVLVVVLGAVLSLAISPDFNLFRDPLNLFLLMLVWGGIVSSAAVAFPAGWIDVLTASVAFALLLLATPYLQLAVMGAPIVEGGISDHMAILLMSLAWFMVWLLVMALFIYAGQNLPMGKRKHHTRVFCPAPPDRVRRALCPLPDTTVAGRICGPEEPSGFFPVRYETAAPNGDSFAIARQAHSYRYRILHEDRLTRQSEATVRLEGRQSRSEIFERLEPVEGGTLYTLVEKHDHFNLLSAIGFWINDFGADHALAYLDEAEGHPSLAIFNQRQRSPISIVSRLFKKTGTP